MNVTDSTLTFAALPFPVTVTACTPNIVRVRLGEQPPDSASSYLPPHTWPESSAAGANASAEINTGNLVIRLMRDPMRLMFFDRSGRAHLKIEIDHVQMRPHLRVRLDMLGEQHFYGLGAGGQQFDRLGAKRRLWTDHLLHGFGADTPIPLLLSHFGYGLFFDHAGLGRLDAGDMHGGILLEYEGEAKALDFYYLGGGIVAAMAALGAWDRRDHHTVRATERAALDLWVGKFSGQPGVKAEIIPDPTDNPLDRLKLSVDPERAGTTAWDLADALAAGDPPVIVRDHEVELGFFQLDPCNLHPGEAEAVAERVVAELTAARTRNDRPSRTAAERRRARFERLLQWPD